MQMQLERVELPAPRALGVDVVRIGKGNKYCIVVSDLDLERPVWVGEGGRKATDLDQFFQSLGENQSGAIEVVVVDTWKPFCTSVAKNAPQAQIVYDKFHILRHLSKALDEVRRSEYKRLRGEEGIFVQGQFYSLLSKRENLKLEGGQALKKRVNANRRVHVAEILKDTFSQLWDYQSEVDALAFFQHWKQGLKRQQLEPYQNFVELVEANWEGIAGYFSAGTSIKPGLVEEINNKIFQLPQQADEPSNAADFRLQILCAFLPALPTSEDTSAALVPEPDNARAPVSLLAWLNLLCHMLPQVRSGIVVQIEEGHCQPSPRLLATTIGAHRLASASSVCGRDPGGAACAGGLVRPAPAPRWAVVWGGSDRTCGSC